MKTYYFSGYWEEPWEGVCGCCSGGGNYYINFDRLEIDGKEVEWFSWVISEYEEVGPYMCVYREEFGEEVPDHIYEMYEPHAISWIEGKLAQKDVVVVLEIAE